MARQIDVFIGGKQSGATDHVVTLNDSALDINQSDDVTPEFTPGQVAYTRVLVDPAGMQDNWQVVEKNLFSNIITNPMGLSDTRSVVKNPGTTRQTIFGSSMEPSGFSTTAAKWNFYNNQLGGVPAYRGYSGGAVDKWNTDGDLQQALGSAHTRRVFLSFKGTVTVAALGNKSGPSLADVDTHFSQTDFPSEASGWVEYLGWWHEPTEDFTTASTQAEYRRQWGLLADYVHNNGPNNLWMTGPTFNGSQMFKTNGINAFPNWWAGNDAQGVPYYDIGSLDLYSRVGRAPDTGPLAGYFTYKALFIDLGWENFIANHPVRKGRWLTGEFASALAGDPLANPNGNYTGPDDPDGSRRAFWVETEMGPNFEQRGNSIEAIFWWSANGNLGDFRLQADNNTPAKWAALCAHTRQAYGW